MREVSGTCHHSMTSLYVNGNLKNIFRMKSDWDLRNFRKWGGLGLELVLGQSGVEVIDIGTNVLSLSLIYILTGQRCVTTVITRDIDSLTALLSDNKTRSLVTSKISRLVLSLLSIIIVLYQACEPSIRRQDLFRKSIHSLQSLLCFFIRSGITESRHQDTCYSPPCFDLTVITTSTDFVYNL